MEDAAILPVAMKQAPEGSKRVFRRAPNGLIARDMLDRPKQGFDVHLGDWLLHDLRPVVECLLLATGVAVPRWLEPRVIHDLWARFQA